MKVFITIESPTCTSDELKELVYLCVRDGAKQLTAEQPGIVIPSEDDIDSCVVYLCERLKSLKWNKHFKIKLDFDSFIIDIVEVDSDIEVSKYN